MNYVVVAIPQGPYKPVVRVFDSLDDLDSVVFGIKSLFSHLVAFSDFVVYSHSDSDPYAVPLDKEVI